MSVPLHKAKYDEASLFAPEQFLGYIRSKGALPAGEKAPKGAILSYQKSLFDFATSRHKVRFAEGYFRSHLAYLEDEGGDIAIVGRFGVGGPAAAVMLEELIAFGCRSFVSMGTAGSLVPGLYPGSLVLCDGALRDEGLSYHYLPEGSPARPDAALTRALGDELTRAGLTYRTGPAWTTDAIYRETRAEMAARVADGALVVEMEAAALFAVAEYRGVALASCFTISDSLAEPEWKPDFLSKDTSAGLEDIYRAAVGALRVSVAQGM